MTEERLQKVMAAAGVASRRASEELIRAGRVRVDGAVITTLGTKVSPESSTILVDGRPIRLPQNCVYCKVYKPKGILSDIGGDSRGRKTVAQLLPPGVGRVFPVGRLDLNSEGLVLLTNDGELANKLTHPRYEHPKTYYVLAAQRPSTAALVTLREGVELESGRTAPAGVDLADNLPARLILDRVDRSAGGETSRRVPPSTTKGVWLRFVLREGKKRQIRHMAAAVGIDLRRLIRWSIGPLTLDGLQPATSRLLTTGEVNALQDMVDGRLRSDRRRRGRSEPRPQRPGPKRRRPRQNRP